LRLFAQTLCFGGKARFEGLGLFETATLLHALLLSVTGGGSAPGVLITDSDTKGRAMMGKCYPAMQAQSVRRTTQSMKILLFSISY
jgi:hypothetical protein